MSPSGSGCGVSRYESGRPKFESSRFVSQPTLRFCRFLTKQRESSRREGPPASLVCLKRAGDTGVTPNMVTCHPAANIIAHKHVPMLGQNRQRSPRFVTAHAATVTRWGHVRQLLCVEFDKDGVKLLFDPKILRNGCVTKAWICPYLKFWAAYYVRRSKRPKKGKQMHLAPI